jgi:hypothetical protein
MIPKDTVELVALAITLATFIPWWLFILQRYGLDRTPRLKELGLRPWLKNWVALAVRTFLLFNLWVVLAAVTYATTTTILTAGVK